MRGDGWNIMSAGLSWKPPKKKGKIGRQKKKIIKKNPFVSVNSYDEKLFDDLNSDTRKIQKDLNSSIEKFNEYLENKEELKKLQHIKIILDILKNINRLIICFNKERDFLFKSKKRDIEKLQEGFKIYLNRLKEQNGS